MAEWQKEIMTLANDFCLNTNKAKEIVKNADRLSVPLGKEENTYKYNKALSCIIDMIMCV